MSGILWDIATSFWTLAIGGGVSVVAMIGCLVVFGPAVVGGVMTRLVKGLLGCRPCLVVLAIAGAAYGGVLVGSNVESAKCEARIEELRAAAEAARKHRDAEVKADLDNKYVPQISALRKEAAQLQQKVKDHAKRASLANAGACKLGAAAHVLRPPEAGPAAGPVAGRPADDVRGHFGRRRHPAGGT